MPLPVRSLALLALATATAGVQAQEESSPFRDQMEYLVRDGGRWLAKNKAYEPGSQQPEYWGYQYEWSLYGTVVKLDIFGVFDGGVQYSYWESVYTWDPVTETVAYYGFAPHGGRLFGHYTRVDDRTMKTTLEGVHPDGSPWVAYDVTVRIDADSFRSETYAQEDGSWVRDSSQDMVWHRSPVSEPRSANAHARESAMAPLQALVGQWTGESVGPDGAPVKQTLAYSWAFGGRLLIASRFIDAGDGPEQVGQTLFTWDESGEEIVFWDYGPDGTYGRGAVTMSDGGFLLEAQGEQPSYPSWRAQMTVSEDGHLTVDLTAQHEGAWAPAAISEYVRASG